MPEETTIRQDYPHVAHYEWPADAEHDDRFRMTPERAAENARHAADKKAVESGRTLRLILAAPILVWCLAVSSCATRCRSRSGGSSWL